MMSRKPAVIIFAFVIAILMTACEQKTEITLNCPDLTSGCTIDNLSVSTNHPPKILKPFELRIQLPDGGVDDGGEVYASFAMSGMEMGLNRYKLIKKAENLWVAEVTLPVCVRGRADWIMQIDTKIGLITDRYLVNFQTN